MKRESEDVIEKATALCQDEREIEAEVLVLEQLESDPDNLELLVKLGTIQARLCKDQKAESTFRTVLSRDPTFEDAICGLGRLLDQSLRTEEAEQIYRDFLRKIPHGHRVLEDLCRLLVSEDRTDEALSLARQHTKHYRSEPSAFDALRYVLQILEDQLESDLNDDRQNEDIFLELLDNLFEQLELVFTLTRVSTAQDILHVELDDEQARLVGEIEFLLASASSRDILISNELQNRLKKYAS